MEVHHVEPQPGAPLVSNRGKPRFSARHDTTHELFLKPVRRRTIQVRRLPTSACDRELAIGQNREAALGEELFKKSRKSDVSPYGFADGLPSMRADRHPRGKPGGSTRGRNPSTPGIDRAVTGNV